MRRAVTWPLLFLAVAVALPAVAQNLPAEKLGFPLTLAGGGTVNSSQVALADLKITGGKAGVKSIIFGTDTGLLHVVYQRASDNAWLEAPGFPVVVCPANTCSGVGHNTPVMSSPAVGDLDGDCVPEIVVGYGTFSEVENGGVNAYRNNGQLLWSRKSQHVIGAGTSDAVVGSPAIGDVDGDGRNDVVWGATDFRVYFVNGVDGTDKPNWPRYLLDTVSSSPVLHDMNGDGQLEIIIGVDAHLDTTFGTPGNGGCLHVMPAAQPVIDPNPNHFPGHIGYPVDLPGFPKCVDQVIFSSPVVGDIDGDGQPDIIHGTGNFFNTGTPKVYAWKKDGSAVAGWPVTISGQMQYNTSPALADLDGNGVLDVVVTADNTLGSGTFHAYAYKGNGTLLPGWPVIPKSFSGATLSAGSPLIADVLGPDFAPEILVPTNTEIAVFSAAGAQLTDGGAHGPLPSFYTPTSLYSVGVADLDPGDGKIEVVAVTGNTTIHVWNPVSRATVPLWGMFHKDPSRSQDAPGTGPCRVYGACPAPSTSPKLFTITPCRLVDTRPGQGTPIGGPALFSGGMRDLALRGLCGIPASAKALSLNVTVVNPTGGGFVRFSPSCLAPNASTINFSAFQVRANNAILSLGSSDGLLTANASVTGFGTVDLIIDVNGYFQ